MQGRSSILGWSMLALFVTTLAILPPAKNFADSLSRAAGGDVHIAYPASTHLCMDGCREHQNWIEFYLAPNSYVDGSLKLKTSLFPAQILTYGLSGWLCPHQERPAYVCLDIGISHRLLSGLTDFGLISLDQLRDIHNWWLEYRPAN